MFSSSRFSFVVAKAVDCADSGPVELTADDLREIDIAASKITVQGDRYPEKLEQLTGR